MPVYNKRGILLLPKVIVLNPKDGEKTDDFLRVFKKNEDIWVCSYRKVKILKESKNE